MGTDVQTTALCAEIQNVCRNILNVTAKTIVEITVTRMKVALVINYFDLYSTRFVTMYHMINIYETLSNYVISCVSGRFCKPDEFTCNNNRCISPKLRCNSINDCGDWTDETYCRGE